MNLCGRKGYPLERPLVNKSIDSTDFSQGYVSGGSLSRRKLLAFSQQALHRAFLLNAPRAAYDDPAAVQADVAAIADSIRKELSELQKKAGRESVGATSGGQHSRVLEAHRDRNLSPKNLHRAKLALNLASSTGIARILASPIERSRLLELAASHLSHSRIAMDADRYENFAAGYGFDVERSESGSFLRFSPASRRDFDAPILALTPTPSDKPLAILGSASPETDLWHGSAFSKATPIGLLATLLDAQNGASNSGSPANERPATEPYPVDESSEAQLETLARQIDQGVFSPASYVFNVMMSNREEFALACELARAEGLLDNNSGLAMAMALTQMDERIEQEAVRISSMRCAAWFDSIAGENAWELVSKIWDSGAGAQATRIRDVEFVASRPAAIRAALEGQEALGLFSIRIANGLGLEIAGRDLAGQAKKALREQFGMTEGAWRLLARMSFEGGHERSRWPFFIGGHDAHLSQRDLDFLNLAGFLSAPQNLSAADERELAPILASAFVATLNACSAAGATPEQAESIFNVLAPREKTPKSLTCWLFFQFQPPLAPRNDGGHGAFRSIAREQQELAERAAFSKKAPILHARFIEKMLAEGPGRALESLMLVSDWLNAAEWGAWQDLPDNPKWSDVNRRQKTWHEMLLRRERSEKELIVWGSLIPGSSDPMAGLEAVALTDGGMLWDEGKAMHHCVSSYAERCQQGTRRIFSILKDGERHGTLELLREDDSSPWRVGQLLGRCNAPIEAESSRAFARSVCSQYLQAEASAKANALQNSEPAPINFPGHRAARKDPPGAAPLGDAPR